MHTVHADETPIDDDVPRRLLEEQLPRWASLPLERVPTYGTDNVLFRLGDDLQVRLPRLRAAPPRTVITQIAFEQEWLPRLRPELPVEIPEVVAVGRPGAGYPYPWAVYRWLDGEPPGAGTIAVATDLAAFLGALQRIDTAGAPAGRGRGGPLAVRDRSTRDALAELQDELDVAAATAAWQRALDAPPWGRAPVWLHGDILEGNLLVRHGRLTGVIDWGCATVGDPAFDFVAAWSLLAGAGRAPPGDPHRRRDVVARPRARAVAGGDRAAVLPAYEPAGRRAVPTRRRRGARGRVIKRHGPRVDVLGMGVRIGLPLFAAAFVADLLSKSLAIGLGAHVYYHHVPGQLGRRVVMSVLAVAVAAAFTVVARRRRLGRPWGAWVGVPLLVAGVLGNGVSSVLWPRGVPDFIPTGDWIGNIADFEIFVGIVGGILALIAGFCLAYAREALAN